MKTLRQFRVIALLEGASFIVLLFVAMPLKYLAGMPLPTRVAGSVHGLLFLLFIAVLIRASAERRWPFRRSLLGLRVGDCAVRHARVRSIGAARDRRRSEDDPVAGRS